MLCAEWYNVVDCRQMSTVESMSKAFFAVDSGACPYPDLCTPEQPWQPLIHRAILDSSGQSLIHREQMELLKPQNPKPLKQARAGAAGAAEALEP
eukprot:1584594-Pyramimonas_sp.AAC.1